ncbi:hypothetical protein, partial [Staphylococcus sp. GDK8D30P]|uniref:hypothetical protein n=1 Tax=Staphylococcus sp. GDK8D30P TaxID=2804090 RepID=UPI001AEBB121
MHFNSLVEIGFISINSGTTSIHLSTEKLIVGTGTGSASTSTQIYLSVETGGSGVYSGSIVKHDL